MFRAGLLVSLLCLLACSETGPGRDPPGQGGEGGSGPSDGGSGGGLPGDETPPTIHLLTPEEGLVVDDPDIVVEGVAVDERGIQELIVTLGEGPALPIEYVLGTDVHFRLPLELAKGHNLIRVEAVDRAGNRSQIERAINWPNAPGRPPVIEVFESTPAVATPGGEFTLRWRVKGTRPITLDLFWPAGASVDGADVSLLGSVSGVAPTMGYELFLLHALNSAGMDNRELYVGVGMDLQLWPRDITIAPGARQRLEVQNASEVQWEADGGQIVELQGILQRPHYAFQAMEPGTYTVTARTDSPVVRAASITIRVVEQEARPTSYKGIGGQMGVGNGWLAPSPVLDSDGSLLLSGGSGEMARYHPASDTWFIERESLANLQMTADGRLFGTRGNTLFFRAPTGEFEAVETGWDPQQHIDALRLGGDGSLLAMVKRPSYGHPRHVWIISPDGTSSQVSVPGDLSAHTATLGADGTLVVAAQPEAGAPAAISMRRPGGEWTDLGALPQITDRVYDLLYTSSGKIFVSGRRLMVWEAGVWTELEEGLPTCREGLCGVFDLHERRDGTILAVSKAAVHELGADGVFRQFGEPSPWMNAKTLVQGAMRAITEGPDGTFYLAGDTGVFLLIPGSDVWSIAGDRGLPPNNSLSDLLVEPDGSLVVTGGGWDGQPGSHSLFRRRAGSSRWEGFADAIGSVDFPESVRRITRDRAGNLYAWADARGIYKIDVLTGKAEQLPRDGFTVEDRYVQDFAAASDGSLYVATRDQTFRLASGAQTWKPFAGLPCARSFLQLPDGGLWAATCKGPVKLVAGTSWTLVHVGLPGGFSHVDARDISRASDGNILLATDKGTFRLAPGSQRWQTLGAGEPSLQSDRITSGGGRTWVISGGTIYELSEIESWLPVDAAPPLSLHDMAIFQATTQGTLLLTGAGLLEAVDRLP